MITSAPQPPAPPTALVYEVNATSRSTYDDDDDDDLVKLTSPAHIPAPPPPPSTPTSRRVPSTMITTEFKWPTMKNLTSILRYYESSIHNYPQINGEKFTLSCIICFFIINKYNIYIFLIYIYIFITYI